ncbi:MAG: Hercynine oxygenase [Anaerolineales bacterium]|nr:Hercynine oxygenase [Anaerolineales bacterium]
MVCILFGLGALALYKIPSPVSDLLHQRIRKLRAEAASRQGRTHLPVSPSAMRVAQADGMTQVFVAEGKFLMGTDSKEAQKNRPRHSVSLSAFWMDRTEVTNAMYAKCVAERQCPPPFREEFNPYYGKSKYANYPVVYISWEGADKYCRWAGRRLPTEAEWEKAARGTDGRSYPWGDEPPNMSLANFDNAIGEPLEVDRYALGASPYGALNMAGNVREWVADWFHEFFYLAGLNENPIGPPSGTVKSLRGGSYLDSANEIRVFNRFFHAPGSPGINRGFRCASNAE